MILQIITGISCLAAIATAYYLYLRKTAPMKNFRLSAFGSRLHALWSSGWGFDTVYQTMIVNPLVFLSRINKMDVIDRISMGLTELLAMVNRLMVSTQNGKIRWYMTVIVIGAILTITIAILI
jgi:NADH-quinone oxidoreductase subunit L